jgi:hypothetical protein
MGAFGKAVIVAALVASTSLCAQNPREDNPQKRQEWFMKGRTLKGESSAELRMRAYRQKLALRAKREQQAANRDGRVTPPFSHLTWTSLGPSPIDSDPTGNQSYGDVTGRVSAIAVDRTDSTGNTVYVGAASGGVWKSQNAAGPLANVTWTPLTDQQPSLAVGSIAIQPGNPNVVLVGTGEGNNSADSYYGIGFLRSTDGGQTWTSITSANNGTRPLRGLAIEQIAFSTANPNLVVAATASSSGASNGGEIQGGDGRGLYYSTDGGVTWSYASVMDPGNIPVAAASTSAVVFNAIHNRFYAVVRFHGIYQSQDAQNWTRMSEPGSLINTSTCTTTEANFSCPLYRGSIAVNQTSGETFLVYVDSGGNFALNGPGIYRLSGVDGTWSPIAQTGLADCDQNSSNVGCGSSQGTYNIYLRAVPRSGSSELYLGFVNIFTCTLTTNATNCSWKNLTHVYGCNPLANPSHVHPDQHAFDFGGSGNNIFYFGNDGGVNRALNGTSASSGSCTATNPFQNVNANLGSFSQIVNFAQHPTDPAILLAGLQDNGSPLLHPLAFSGTKWKGINTGDGGFSAIDPANLNTYYTSAATNGGTVIERCTQGSSCTPGTQTAVVTSAKYGTDDSAFYMPFILDPADPTRIIVGTCRVWRGLITSPTLTATSNNFSTGNATVCGANDSKIRSVAAGGPTSGASANVIYAATESALGAPRPGHIFVSTNAAAGAASWADRTGSINRSEFDVSSIALSPHDPSGQTAYATIMGFGTSHVWKTTDAGLSWVDKTADLPDAPTNVIVVDPTNASRLYVGNDVGVFVSVDDGLSWAELGSGLPTAVVSDLKIFNSGGVQRLRAATYGRGVWDIPLPGALGLTFSANTLAFDVVIGTALSRMVTVTNSTTGNVNIGSVSITGNFTKDGGCVGATLAPGASCSVSVSFGPASQGTYNGTLSFVDSAAGSPHAVALVGNSFNVVLSLVRPTRPGRPGSSQAADRALKQQVTVTMTGSVTDRMVITPACRAIRRHSTCSLSASTLELSAATGYSATFAVELNRKHPRGRRLLKGATYERVLLTLTFPTTARTWMVPVSARD